MFARFRDVKAGAAARRPCAPRHPDRGGPRGTALSFRVERTSR